MQLRPDILFLFLPAGLSFLFGFGINIIGIKRIFYWLVLVYLCSFVGGVFYNTQLGGLCSIDGGPACGPTVVLSFLISLVALPFYAIIGLPFFYLGVYLKHRRKND